MEPSRWHDGKEPPADSGDARDTGLITGLGRFPWSRKWQPVFLPGKFHGQRSLVGSSPWGHKESNMPERLSTHTHGAFTSSLPCTLSKSLPDTQQTPPKKGQSKEGQHMMCVESAVGLESKCSSPEWRETERSFLTRGVTTHRVHRVTRV